MKVSILVFVAIATLITNWLPAQINDDVRQRRRDFIENLLKVVVESQQDRDIQPRRPDRAGGRLPSIPPQSQITNPKLKKCRSALTSFEQECSQLIVELRKEERRLPRLRPLLADAIGILAAIKHLNTHASRLNSIQPLVDPYCNLDASWRLFHHRLNQVRDLPQPCMRCLTKCNGFNSQLTKIFEIQPQINRHELRYYCAEMSSHFQHLIQDIYYEFNSEQERRQLIRDCQAIYARINETVPLIQTGRYDSIVSIYRQCADQWKPLKIRLLDCPRERIRRHCHTIESCGNHIRELLWIPVEFDHQYLAKICSRLQRDVDQIFSSYTLNDLLAVAQPGLFLGQCREFQKQGARFEACIKTSSPFEQIATQFQLFANAWQALRATLETRKVARIERRLAACDEHFEVFRETFGNGPLIDHYTMLQICADLDQYSLQLDQMIHRRIVQGYERKFSSQFKRVAEKFQQSVHELHEHAVSNRRHELHAQKDLRNALAHWNKLKANIRQCKEVDRRELNQLRSRIEPLMAKLQVVYFDAS